jgi:hypothetical protein
MPDGLRDRHPSNLMEYTVANPENFEDIQNMNIDDIEDNVLIPKGTYIVLVKGMPERGVSSQKQTPFWQFKFTAIEATGDVDKAELEDVGGLQNLDLSHEFYQVPKALPMFRDFLKNAMGLSNMTVTQAVAESTGRQCRVHVSHEPTRRRDNTVGLRAVIDQFLPA